MTGEIHAVVQHADDLDRRVSPEPEDEEVPRRDHPACSGRDAIPGMGKVIRLHSRSNLGPCLDTYPSRVNGEILNCLDDQRCVAAAGRIAKGPGRPSKDLSEVCLRGRSELSTATQLE